MPMTWGHVFLICICWIAGSFLLQKLLHVLDKRLHFQNHAGWNDLGRAIMGLILTLVPPLGFIVGYTGYKTYLASPTFLLVLLLTIPVVVFLIWRIYVYVKVKRPLKECRKPYEVCEASGSSDEETAGNAKIIKWIEETKPEGGYPAFRDKYVKLWGNPYSYLVTEHYIQAEYIVSQLAGFFYRLRKVYNSIPLKEKKALVDVILRYDQNRFPPITFRKDGFPEGAERLVKWSYAEEEKEAGIVTCVFLTFGDGTVYILRLVWEGRVFSAVREKETKTIEELKMKFLKDDHSQTIELSMGKRP